MHIDVETWREKTCHCVTFSLHTCPCKPIKQHLSSLLIFLPINARAVPPGFPQATGRVYIVSIAAVGQQRVEAVESVGPVQMPPAAG